MNKTSFIWIILVLLSSCDLSQKDIKPEDEFLKIFSHPDEQLKFYPQSVSEVSDGGFIILSGLKMDSAENEFPTSHLIGTNKIGELSWTSENQYFAPEGNLINQGSSLSYVAMDNQLNGIMISINPTNGELTGQVTLDLKMPLFSYENNAGNILVLGHDNVNRSSEISLYNKDFNRIRTSSLSINTDLENLIQKHLNKSGNQYPFFIGEITENSGNGFFVNCFSNYSLRVVFYDEAGNPLPGDIYSFQTEAAISSLIQKTDNRFALSRYYAGNNYLIPDIEVDQGVSQNFNSIEATTLFELSPDASVKSLKYTLEKNESILFASQTNSNSLIIYRYDIETDEQISVFQQDFNNRIEVSDMIQSSDNGVVILGQIFVLGKFPRPFLLKIPEREL